MEAPAKPTEVILTRKELHKRAWKIPLEALAQELNVTSRELITILDGMQIPHPDTSYWKRKQEGKFVVDRKLPKSNRNTPPKFVFQDARLREAD